MCVDVFLFKDTATTETSPLSRRGALPISCRARSRHPTWRRCSTASPPARRWSCATERCSSLPTAAASAPRSWSTRSEEHTSELQSRQYLVCRLLLEKQKYFSRTSDSHFLP